MQFDVVRRRCLFLLGDRASRPMALVLRYHKTFIDVTQVPEPRAQSCPPMRGQMHEADEALREEAFCKAHVQKLMETEKDSPFLERTAASVGSRGHPECCRRPCVHFARGWVSESLQQCARALRGWT